MLSTQVMRRGEIGGWRILPTQYISTLELTPSESSRKKLKFGLTIKIDPEFQAWFAGIPNVDTEQLARSEAEIAAHEELGITPDQRAMHFARARKIAAWLTRITYVLALWGRFYPRPYQFVILALMSMPLVVIVLLVRSQGLYQIEGRRNDARPSLALPFIVPGAVLALRSISDFEFLQWKPLLPWVVIGALGITLIVASADWGMRERRWPILVILLFGAMYAYGAIAQADTLLDKSAPETFEATILSKRISSGRSTTWYLQVGPWGPQREATEVSVPRSLYDAVFPEQTVCIHLSDGAMKIPWYFVSICQ